MLSKAIRLAKGTEEPKIGLSVQVPKSLKVEFENICIKNGISMSSMLLSLIQVAVDEDLIADKNVDTVSSLQSTLMTMNELIENNVDESDVGFNPIVVKKATERKLNILAGINPDEEE